MELGKNLQIEGMKMKEYLITKEIIREEYYQTDVNTIMKEVYRPRCPKGISREARIRTERTMYVLTVEKFLSILEDEKEFEKIHEGIEIEKEDWYELKNIRYEEREPKELDKYTESISVKGDEIVLEDEYVQRTIWKRKIPTQEKPITMTTVVEKFANEEMKIMYDFLKKHFQGRIDRKPRDIDEFCEDVLYYFTKRQTRRYDQDWEERLCNTLEELDPERDWEEKTTKKRIKELKKVGVELKVYKRLTTKQAMQKKEEEMEKEILRKTKKMNPMEAYIYRERIIKEQKEEKDQPSLENEITNRLLDEERETTAP
jgi:hypothetical protein